MRGTLAATMIALVTVAGAAAAADTGATFTVKANLTRFSVSVNHGPDTQTTTGGATFFDVPAGPVQVTVAADGSKTTYECDLPATRSATLEVSASGAVLVVGENRLPVQATAHAISQGPAESAASVPTEPPATAAFEPAGARRYTSAKTDFVLGQWLNDTGRDGSVYPSRRATFDGGFRERMFRELGPDRGAALARLLREGGTITGTPVGGTGGQQKAGCMVYTYSIRTKTWSRWYSPEVPPLPWARCLGGKGGGAAGAPAVGTATAAAPAAGGAPAGGRPTGPAAGGGRPGGAAGPGGKTLAAPTRPMPMGAAAPSAGGGA